MRAVAERLASFSRLTALTRREVCSILCADYQTLTGSRSGAPNRLPGCDCKGGNEPDCGCRNVPTLGPQVAIDATPMLHRPKAAWRMKVVMPEPASLRFLIILREVPLFLLPPFPSTAFLVIRCPLCVHRQETPSLMCSRAPVRLMDWSVFSCSDSFPPPPTSHEQPVQRAVSHFSMLNVLAGRGEAWAQVLSPQAAGEQALRRYVVGLWRC